MKTLLTALVIVMVLAVIGPPALAIQRYGQTQFTSGFWGQKVEWVWSFVTAGPHAIMVWKADSVVARVAKPCTNTVAQAFTDTLDWGPYHRLALHSKAGDTGWVQTCTAFVTGLDSSGVAKTCTTAIADGDTVVWVQKTWTKIRTIKFGSSHLSDSVLCYGYPIKCVTTSTSAKDVKVAGVLMDSVVAKTKYSGTGYDGYGRLVVDGIFPVKMTAEARRAGTLIATSTAAETAYTAAATVGPNCVLGKALYATGAVKGVYPVIINIQ
jgi:hypothetical protein